MAVEPSSLDDQDRQTLYHRCGTRRYWTLCVYSTYPGRSFLRRLSSSRILQASNGVITAIITSPHHEPSANGIPMTRNRSPTYLGCRTSAYGPVEMTCWPSKT